MKCSSCGHENESGANYCASCNNNLSVTATPSTSTYSATQNTSPSQTASSSAYTTPQSPPQSTSASSTSASASTTTPSTTQSYNSQSSYASGPAYSATQVYNGSRSASSYPYQQPYYYQPVMQRPKQPFTITDAYIIIGFVLAIVGIFSYAFILLPTSIAFSVVGFVKRTNARTLGLSIAGIVVGVVACLIKIGMVLNELGFIPDWLSAGIF